VGEGAWYQKLESEPPGLGYRRVRLKPETELAGFSYRCVVGNDCGGNGGGWLAVENRVVVGCCVSKRKGA
jgi:hypothetical protein